MATVQFDLWRGRKPNPTQLRLINDPAQYIIWSGPRGQSKTFGLCVAAAHYAISVPGNRVLLGRAFADDLYGSTLKTWYDCFPQGTNGITYYGGHRPKVALFPNGSEVHFVGFDRATKHLGADIGAFCIDQVEELEEDKWLSLEANLRLQHVPRNFLFGRGVCNPKGHYWAYLRFREHLGVPQEYHSQYLWLKANPRENERNLPKGYYEKLAAAYPPHLRARFVEGSDEDFEGAAFPYFDGETQVKELPWEATKDWEPWVSMDHGWSHATCFLFGYWDHATGTLYIRDEHYHNRMTVDDHVRIVRQLCEQIKFPLSKARMVGDHAMKATKNAEGHSIWDAYRKEGFVFESVNKQLLSIQVARINQMCKKSEKTQAPMLLIDPSCRNTIKQLRTLGLDDKERFLGEDEGADCLTYLVGKLPDTWESPNKPKVYGTYEDWTRAEKEGCSPTRFPSTWNR